MMQVKVSQWIRWLTPVLHQALKRLDMLASKSVEYVHKNHTECYIAGDVTEIPVQRKTDNTAQKEDFSGKQKTHKQQVFCSL